MSDELVNTFTWAVKSSFVLVMRFLGCEQRRWGGI